MYKIIKSVVILGLVFFLLAYYFYLKSINHSFSDEFSPVAFNIEKGEGPSVVAEHLLNEGLISSRLYFKIYIWRSGLEKKFQAGNYVLSPSMTTKEIVDLFINGKVIKSEKDIKIIEGWTLSDIAINFEKNNISSAEDFLSLTQTPVDKWVFDFKKPDFLNDIPSGHDLEGYIFPDTYRVYNNASISDILKKTFDNFDRKVDRNIRLEIKKQGRTLHDVITLASIVEKEVRSDKDKKIVAGILLKRMRIGMKLEVDSSINYITGKNDPGAFYADLNIDSPYNTYKYYGLPPGPICNPSLSSIEAVLYPEESPYLFYLNRQDTLETIFSRDYDEHIRNKNKYLR